MISVSVVAQELPFSDHEKQIKQGNDRIVNENRPLLQRQDIFLQDLFSSDDPSGVDADSDVCVQVNTVKVTGVTKFSTKTIENLTQPYHQRCINLNHVNQLVTDLSNLYLNAGFVTSRAYINPQHLSTGVLEIVVLEGFIEAIESVHETLSETQLSLAFPTTKQKLLNLRDLEQGLENLNRLGKNQATMSLVPGNTQGGTVVSVQNRLGDGWRGSIGLNNTGVEDTGELQLDANLSLDNVLGINDNFVASLSSNVGEHDLPVAESRSVSLVGSLPYHYWFFRLSNSYFEYEQSVLGNNVDFTTRGSSFNSSFEADVTVYRGQSQKLNVKTSLSRKESKNYIEDIFLETSSRTLYLWDLSASYLKHLRKGTLTADFTVSKSVPWFGATEQLVSAEVDYQFTKYTLDAGISRHMKWGEQSVNLSSQMHLLYSPEVILASEGLTVGGRYSVRGLSQRALFGYRGGYLRNDFLFPVSTPWDQFGQTQLMLGVDVGASNLPEFPDENSDWVAGSALGFTFLHRDLSVSFTYAKALRTPDFIDDSQEELDVFVRMNF
ncbi:peptide transporter [Marinibactrum halimedae]|uniref:Peptide transporter n=1 Tax=Marinibactrum halimedae TaxID=1444977 RepID=A0AA37T7G6_9GAMM|nr:peptide transporter [Marinibactrum halimedae]